MADQINKIQKKLSKNGMKNVLIKKVQYLWIVSQNGTEGPIYIFNQRAWEAFVKKVMNDLNDNLFNDQCV